MRQFTSVLESTGVEHTSTPTLKQIAAIVKFLHCPIKACPNFCVNRCSEEFDISDPGVLIVSQYVKTFDFQFFDFDSLIVSPELIRLRVFRLMKCPYCSHYETCLQDNPFCKPVLMNISTVIDFILLSRGSSINRFFTKQKIRLFVDV